MIAEKIHKIENEILRRVAIVCYIIAIIICLPFKTLYDIIIDSNTMAIVSYNWTTLLNKINSIILYWR